MLRRVLSQSVFVTITRPEVDDVGELVAVDFDDHALRGAGPGGDLVDGETALDLEGDGGCAGLARGGG